MPFSGKALALLFQDSESGVRGREVEHRPRNLEVPSSIAGSGCQLWDFSIGLQIRLQYWCSSQEAASREIV